MRIAGVQLDVTIGDVEGNLGRLVDWTERTRSKGAALTIFPECALTGYCFESLEEARPYSQTIPGPATEIMSEVCGRLGGFVVYGMLEQAGDQLFNAAVLVGAKGVVGSYRKVHLPYLGVDRFVSYGDRPFAVHEADSVKIGMHICYDGAFPEAPRAMMLQGADLLVLPTNWPPGAECIAATGTNLRAMENSVYYAAVNRVGNERGFRFIGTSRICDPSGKTLAEASETDETALYAEVDPDRSRRKRIVRVPDKHIIDRLADRRPEMYSLLTEPHSHPRPRDA